jgi:hypothetical protein
MVVDAAPNPHGGVSTVSPMEMHASRFLTAPSQAPMVVETWTEMLREKLKHILPLLRLGALVDAFLGAWTSSVHLLAG